ncbi:uncharacterized protein LOC131853919 [Achroia grisella]|uniref:uncharacterized protein LOC131853919 n=1 Tax=Achroia grisella TaxID=688607 RepID=UPI0027D33E36|nr:uncharacterized protein LOC131853919 [Achroia grisella]
MLGSCDGSAIKLLEFLEHMNLRQYVTKPTHFTDHSKTLLDVICSSSRVMNVIIDYVPDLSSHAFISCELNVRKPKPVPRWITYRPLGDIDIDVFNEHVNCIPWELLMNGNINESVVVFNMLISALFDIHAPVKTLYLKDRSYPWITQTIKDMMRLRDKAQKVIVRNWRSIKSTINNLKV